MDSEEEPEGKPEISQDPNSTVYLVQKAHGGSVQALEELFTRYYPRVRKFVRPRLGGHLRQHMESVDIVQGTFAQAAKGFDNFEWKDEKSLINWLSKHAEHQILEAVGYFTTQSRHKKNEVQLDAPLPGKSETPSTIVSARERTKILRDCLDSLPEKHREVIALRTFGQLPFDAVAEETGRPSSDAARMAYNKAIEELEKLMRARGCS